jgi:hypothetical protein
MESSVKEIRPSELLMETRHGTQRVGNDTVIVCAGGVLPNDFLASFGVRMSTARGRPM